MNDINDTPAVDFEKCTGCTRCVGICPGLAIFVVKIKDEKASITFPYEFLPLPTVGNIVHAVDREGKTRGTAKIMKVNTRAKTAVITVEVDKTLAMDIRMIKVMNHD